MLLRRLMLSWRSEKGWRVYTNLYGAPSSPHNTCYDICMIQMLQLCLPSHGQSNCRKRIHFCRSSAEAAGTSSSWPQVQLPMGGSPDEINGKSSGETIPICPSQRNLYRKHLIVRHGCCHRDDL